MIRKQALAELIAKVEAGFCPLKQIANAGFGKGSIGNAVQIRSAFHGSLDAALALHEAVLPGWEYGYDGSIAWVKLHTSYRHDELGGYTARAWLLAILKALHAQETQ